MIGIDVNQTPSCHRYVQPLLSVHSRRAHARITEVEARLGSDSTNSSTPSSQDSIAAKAKRRAYRSSRERSKDHKPGGQPGRKGSGLAPTVTPDQTETLPPPGDCSGCCGDLAGAADAGMSWAQVWDILAITEAMKMALCAEGGAVRR